MKKRILSLTVAVLLVLSVSPQVSLAADYYIYSGGIYDLSAYGNGNAINIFTKEAVTITNTTGATYTDVELCCLESGVSLTLDGVKIVNNTDWLCALSFNGAGNTLTLAGTITLQSGTYEPGIRVEKGEALTIRGTGTADVQGGTYAAGIGGGIYDDCGSITIESGTLLVTGGSNSAGIGGGEHGAGGNITVKDGNVTAVAVGSGAGIGTGSEGVGGTITIEDGIVNATGGMSGAGIGSGYGGTTESINISGGDITAVGGGGGGGAGIGSGNGGTPGSISISGGDITASSEEFGAGIGGGMYTAGGTIHIKDCKVVATGGESGAGIGGGSNGSSGTIRIEDSDVTANGGYYAAGIGAGEGGSGETIIIDGGTVKAKGGTASDGYNGAGIGGGRYGSGGRITIESGSVTATGGSSGAGIGSGDNYYTGDALDGGIITINDGMVTAKGGGRAAGIGGGDSSTSGSIAINGGTVVATGGSNGAGIGGGASGNCDSVVIKGGAVTAAGGSSGAGIGGGGKGAGGVITIEAGIITATGGTSGAGIGGGAGTGGTAGTIKILSAATVKAVASSTTRPAIFASGNTLATQSTANVLVANFSAQKNANTVTQFYRKIDAALLAEVTPRAKYQSVAITVPSGVYRVKTTNAVQQFGTSPNISTDFSVTSGLVIFGSVANAASYNITVSAATGGNVIADVAKAVQGDTIGLTVTPVAGWRLKSLAYNDSTAHAVTGTSFVMPAANVTVTAVFEEIPDIPVIWMKAVADGAEDVSSSTKIDLIFDAPVTGLTAADISLADGTGQAVKGTLSGSGTSWSIALGSVAIQGTVSVSVLSPDGYTIMESPKAVTVYKKTSASLSSLTVGGVPVSGFTPGVYTYNVTLPYGSLQGGEAAAVDAAATVPAQTVVIAQVSALPGDAVVTVYATDGTKQRYILHMAVNSIYNTPPAAKADAAQKVTAGETLRFMADAIAQDADGDAMTITAVTEWPDAAVAAVTLVKGTITVEGIAKGWTVIRVTVSDSIAATDIVVPITVAKATATPNPSPSATVTVAPSPAPSPTVPAQTPSPSSSPSPSEMAVVTITPDSVEHNEQTGAWTIVIGIDKLPDGSAALRLADGTVVKPDESGRLIFRISEADYDAGTLVIAVLDNEGTPLGRCSLQTDTLVDGEQETGSSLLSTLLWIIFGLLVAAGVAAAVVIILKKKRVS